MKDLNAKNSFLELKNGNPSKNEAILQDFLLRHFLRMISGSTGQKSSCKQVCIGFCVYLTLVSTYKVIKGRRNSSFCCSPDLENKM